MANIKQINSNSWSNTDGSLVINLEDGRYVVYDDEGERASIGTWERLVQFIDLISD